MDEYKSTEEIVCEWLGRTYKSVDKSVCGWLDRKTKPARDYVSGYVPSFYGAVVTPLRVSTFIRKMKNGQTHIDRINSNNNVLGSGATWGVLFGAVADIVGIGYLINEAHNGNSLPLQIAGGVAAGANAASGIFEAATAGRWDKVGLEGAVGDDAREEAQTIDGVKESETAAAQ